MKQNIIVLSVNPYRMNDNGRTNEGVSIRYLPTDALAPVVNSDFSLGTRPAKDNLPYSFKDLFVTAPGLYEADLALKVGSDGKPVMSITSIAFVSEIKAVQESGKGKVEISK